jgi:cell division transport system permease protein
MDITTMKLSRNRTGYYIKEGFSSIFAHGLMSFASVCIIAAFLIILGSFIMLAMNITALIGNLESENVILAFVDERIESEIEARAIALPLSALPNVTSVEFVSRSEALDAFIGTREDFQRLDGIDETWLRHRFIIYVEDVADIPTTQREISQVIGIERVNAHLGVAEMLISVRQFVRIASVFITAVLLAISLFIMSNTIKLATFERREEIAIMKIVGATNGFIRWPFIYEGFILGMIGSLSAFGSVWGLYNAVAGRVVNFEAGIIRLIPFEGTLIIQMVAAFVAIGFCVGVGGSGFALNKYLKV